MEKLIYYFAQAGFKDHEIEIIIACFHQIKLSKGDFFVKEGRISKQLGFIDKGYLQYYIILDDEEKTTYSVGENELVVSLISFLKQIPAKENIRAVMDTSIWVIEREQLKHLQENLPSFKSFYISLLEWQICCIDESRLDAIMLKAPQRYEKMLEKEPNLIQNIPLQYLASILGVTPRHLSRIRKSIR
ncbi:MAG: Crp/Fnr family transcriptional regulator [Saprospiraceae bacterium]